MPSDGQATTVEYTDTGVVKNHPIRFTTGVIVIQIKTRFVRPWSIIVNLLTDVIITRFGLCHNAVVLLTQTLSDV